MLFLGYHPGWHLKDRADFSMFSTLSGKAGGLQVPSYRGFAVDGLYAGAAQTPSQGEYPYGPAG